MSTQPPTRPSVVPYIVGDAAEDVRFPQRIGTPMGLIYPDETPYDRDINGALWVRTGILPPERRRDPVYLKIHPYRQVKGSMGASCRACEFRRSVPGPLVEVLGRTVPPSPGHPIPLRCVQVRAHSWSPLHPVRTLGFTNRPL